MKCPYCESEKGSNVAKTVKCADGVIRIRICFECHKAYTTTETADKEVVVA